MRPLMYLQDKDSLKSAYLSLYDIKNMQKEWDTLLTKYSFLNVPTQIDDILTADFDTLVDMYYEFTSHKIDFVNHLKSSLDTADKDDWEKSKKWKDLKKEQIKQFENLFDYEKYSEKIASFLTDKARGLDLSTCYYCGINYINIYTKASKNKRIFDIEHVLDKGSCPIISLSLFNLVPSCSFCNSRLKGSKLIGGNNSSLNKKLSPLSQSFSIETKISFKIQPKPGRKATYFEYLKHSDDYEIEIYYEDRDYEHFVNFFDIKERYDFHKCEALRIRDLRIKYSNSRINELARLFQLPFSEIYEDIFGEVFNNIHSRAFRKMRLDILNE